MIDPRTLDQIGPASSQDRTAGAGGRDAQVVKDPRALTELRASRAHPGRERLGPLLDVDVAESGDESVDGLAGRDRLEPNSAIESRASSRNASSPMSLRELPTES